MNLWDWLWAWMRDPAVWDWLRPTGAALLGAVVGGLFTLWGQRQSAAQQIAREEAESKRQRGETLRDQSRDDAKLLFTAFAELERDIKTSERTLAQYLDGEQWYGDWKRIWTRQKSLDLQVRSRLLTDPTIREQLERVVRFLDSAPTYSDGGAAELQFSSPIDTTLYDAVRHLAEEGAEILAAYLRGDAHTTRRSWMWEELAKAEDAYRKWEDHEIERMEARAEEEAEDAARQEIS